VTYQARRVTSAAERTALMASIEELEPRSTILRGEVARAGRRGLRLFVAEDGERVGGLAAVYRICWDLWEAAIVLLDEDAAPVLARAIDRSPAREVYGSSADLQPLVAHLPRLVRTSRMPCIVIPPPLPEPISDLADSSEGTRRATRGDVRQLARLYEGFELDAIPTMVQLRRHFRRLLRQDLPVFLYFAGDEVVGASKLVPITDRFALSTDTTLIPSARGQRAVWILMFAAYDEMRERGVGFLGTLAPTNPIKMETLAPAVEGFGGHIEDWSTIVLRTPVRFRGQGRLRSAWSVLGGRRRHRAAVRVRPDGQ
jgi:hypothetical protein